MSHSLRRAPFRPTRVQEPHVCILCRAPVDRTYAPEEIPIAYTDGSRWLCPACYCEYKDDYEWPASESYVEARVRRSESPGNPEADGGLVRTARG